MRSCAWAPRPKARRAENAGRTTAQCSMKACRAYRTVSFTRADSRGCPPDIRLERPVDFHEMPHPAHTPELGFESVEDLDPSTVDRLAIVGPHIYTDGSKIEGKVGAALTEWRDEMESRNSAFRLESFCTVFQAEMFALHRAIKARQDIRDIVAEGRRLFWVLAHAGTTGNERADELARNAALKGKRQRITIAFRCRTPKGDQGGEPGRVAAALHRGGTGEINRFPRVEGAYRVLSRFTITPPIAQTLTGHGGFAQYLNRFKLKDSPYCACAPDKVQDVLHVLEECPIFGRERAETEAGTGVVVARHSFPALLDDEINRKHFEVLRAGHATMQQN
ncbi:Putative 115 kDa protein in type-1 retrotransposable element R1DM [Eumeta japonica]|uniref:115 kDa protein in type-1 retrotransposable element R1DM n=1 Tax=Eumeta variegata TaxID=151549 RepID=A0A4C1XCT1_EUMVA|nr:Putative 115 kDa protein in type-1 retrotransposable element R1DM [Eumeta japonica]